MTADKSAGGTLASGAALALVGGVIGRGGNFALQVYLARLLGPGDFGVYAIALALVLAIGLVVPLGLDTGLLHFGAEHRDRPQALAVVVAAAIAAVAVWGGMTALLVFASSSFLGSSVFHNTDLTVVLKWSSPVLMGIAITQVAAAGSRIHESVVGTVVARDIVQPVSNLIFLLLALQLWDPLTAAGAAFSGSFLASGFTALLFLPKGSIRAIRDIDLAIVWNLLGYSTVSVVANVATQLPRRTDRLIVGYYRPATEVGVFQAAGQLATVFTVVEGAFNTIFTPMIAAYHHDGKIEQLEVLYRQMTKWSLYISLPLFMPLMAAPDLFLEVIYGDAFSTGALVLVLLCIAQLINVVTGPTGPVLLMTRHHELFMRISTTALVLNILAAIAVVPRWGVVGVAVVSIFVMVFRFWIGIWFIKARLNIFPFDRRHMLLSIYSIAGIAILAIARGIAQGIPSLAVIGALFVLSFILGILIFALLPYDPADQAIKDRVWSASKSIWETL